MLGQIELHCTDKSYKLLAYKVYLLYPIKVERKIWAAGIGEVHTSAQTTHSGIENQETRLRY